MHPNPTTKATEGRVDTNRQEQVGKRTDKYANKTQDKREYKQTRRVTYGEKVGDRDMASQPAIQQGLVWGDAWLNGLCSTQISRIERRREVAEVRDRFKHERSGVSALNCHLLAPVLQTDAVKRIRTQVDLSLHPATKDEATARRITFCNQRERESLRTLPSWRPRSFRYPHPLASQSP
ncbi:hypothetical protein C0Q70_17242 [Pomacea canaliculata]|uniref:Uncharacterized protein n=1 Tax=Pomacea canaliculata TaxID=400727 RepID=A0A2T7NS33_POMCA|nr:hypothetical protein C0Q70_17242 [Pomacea canaliculata]